MTIPRQGDNFRTLSADDAAPILRGWLAHVASTPTLAGRINARTPEPTPYAPIRKDGR